MSEEKADMFSLTGKVIIVTGGTGVLGSAFVKAILRHGAAVVLICIDEEAGKARAEEINNAGGDALSICASVLEETQLIAARATILAKYGRIDGLVNAAGGNVPEGVLSPTADIFNLDIDGMKKAMVLNIWGTVIPVQVFGAELAKSGHGSIVNISSVSSKRALTRVLGYSMGKAAVDCYTKWIAVEMANRHGDKVRMNSIMPGFFLTDQNRSLLTNADGSLTDRGNSIISHTPFKRFGHPDELTGALIWLLIDASKFVTGMDIGVDGGFTVNSGV
jgi:NAD(P)-dependent dehydrogenase (short-subunit alcohol dehydrogenase family)